MKYIVRYIPLDQIKPDSSVAMTDRLKKLRGLVWDSMHLIAVRPNRKDRSYTLLSGWDRYEYLSRHTRKTHAPCIIEDRETVSELKARLFRYQNRRLLSFFPSFDRERITPAGLAIIRSFLKQEPRFRDLSVAQRIRVLLLAVRYKQAMIGSMRAMVDDLSKSGRRR